MAQIKSPTGSKDVLCDLKKETLFQKVWLLLDGNLKCHLRMQLSKDVIHNQNLLSRLTKVLEYLLEFKFIPWRYPRSNSVP